MRKYNWLMVLTIAGYLILSGVTAAGIRGYEQQTQYSYKVEINRILDQLQAQVQKERQIEKAQIDLHTYRSIKKVTCLTAEQFAELAGGEEFLMGENGMSYELRALTSEGEIIGYARFEYVTDQNLNQILVLAELLLAVIAAAVLGLLLYLRANVIRPFVQFSEVPYELAKGHLRNTLEENKSRFFGRFIWGVSVLSDRLESDKRRELRLEKEKKLLLLSLSHDIKTPLNTIKLYAKALEEGLYETETERGQAVKHIGEKAAEIESYIKEIVKTSSEDILEIEVKPGEFYIDELVKKIRGAYTDRCELCHLSFEIGSYENKLLKGDIDRAFEAIENLMENAMKYGDGRAVSITFSREEYCQLIHVHNTGEAVSQQEYNHLFESFFRGKNVAGKDGSGLGLYICKQIMHKMNGDIYAQICEDGMEFVLVFEE